MSGLQCHRIDQQWASSLLSQLLFKVPLQHLLLMLFTPLHTGGTTARVLQHKVCPASFIQGEMLMQCTSCLIQSSHLWWNSQLANTAQPPSMKFFHQITFTGQTTWALIRIKKNIPFKIIGEHQKRILAQADWIKGTKRRVSHRQWVWFLCFKKWRELHPSSLPLDRKACGTALSPSWQTPGCSWAETEMGKGRRARAGQERMSRCPRLPLGNLVLWERWFWLK